MTLCVISFLVSKIDFEIKLSSTPICSVPFQSIPFHVLHNAFQKESICAVLIICLEHLELLDYSVNRNNSECCLEVQLVVLLGEYG